MLTVQSSYTDEVTQKAPRDPGDLRFSLIFFHFTLMSLAYLRFSLVFEPLATLWSDLMSGLHTQKSTSLKSLPDFNLLTPKNWVFSRGLISKVWV